MLAKLLLSLRSKVSATPNGAPLVPQAGAWPDNSASSRYAPKPHLATEDLRGVVPDVTVPAVELDRILSMFNEGRHAELEPHALSLASQYPGSGIVWLLLGISQHVQGKTALPALRKATVLMPDAVSAHSNLGVVLRSNGLWHDAIVSFRRACEIDPGSDENHCNLGSALQVVGNLEEAAECFRRTLDINPANAGAHSNCGLIAQSFGQLEVAETSYLKALEIDPGFGAVRSNLLFLYAFHAMLPPQEYLARARQWELSSLPDEARQAARQRVFRRSPPAGRRLRVGYLSGHYRRHPVSDNIEQLFAHHDRTRIELFAYSASGHSDAVTVRIQDLVEHWISVVGMADAAIRDRIDADEIDVLVDLAGHTEEHRLGVFARRAAPVQVYYLGYFASTGLSEMDYLIGDQILTPPETDRHFSEQVWRLPRIWECYNGQDEAPLPQWQPALDGSVYIGTFNNFGKLTPATLDIWASVLQTVPEAKLLLKAKDLALASNRQQVLDVMSSHGILPERIELYDWSVTPGWREHMAFYNRLDIALDPVGGMSGGNTTCEALWMGVPVVTLAGDRMSSRISATILDAVGHPDWIANSLAQYADKVVALARNVELRKSLRAIQRSQMAASSLCDAHGLAIQMESAYRDMFEIWYDRKNSPRLRSEHSQEQLQ